MSVAQVSSAIEVNILGKVKKTIKLPPGVRVLAPGEPVPAGCDVLRLLHQEHGDIRIVWDSNNFSEISDAKSTFDRLIEEGMVPYLVDPETGKATQITAEFDPFAEEIVMRDDHRKPVARPAGKRREIVATPQPMLAGG